MSLVIRSLQDIYNYCSRNGISVKSFNEPVQIADDVVDCSQMFYGCESFNQHVIIPAGVKRCFEMFRDCKKVQSAY